MRRVAVLAAIAAALVSPAAADASRTQQTMMEDSTQLLTLGDSERDFTLDQFKALGTEIVKVRVEWRDIAPDPASRRKPAGFDATDPLSGKEANNNYKFSHANGAVKPTKVPKL